MYVKTQGDLEEALDFYIELIRKEESIEKRPLAFSKLLGEAQKKNTDYTPFVSEAIVAHLIVYGKVVAKDDMSTSETSTRGSGIDFNTVLQVKSINLGKGSY